jgi:hypothetical protein
VGKRQGGDDGGVCGKEAAAVRENGLGERDQKTEEGIWWFPNPAIFVCWRAVAICPIPRIFVGVATSPMNICGLYSSVTWFHR